MCRCVCLYINVISPVCVCMICCKTMCLYMFPKDCSSTDDLRQTWIWLGCMNCVHVYDINNSHHELGCFPFGGQNGNGFIIVRLSTPITTCLSASLYVCLCIYISVHPSIKQLPVSASICLCVYSNCLSTFTMLCLIISELYLSLSDICYLCLCV